MDWYPFYPSLYRADTMHLTAEQDGIYRRLIDHYMETGHPLPDNDTALARIAGVDTECFKHASSIVRAFFKHKSDGYLYHKRCELTLEAQQSRQKSRSEIAKKAAEKRWNNQKVECIEHASSNSQAMLGDAIRQDKTRNDKERITPIIPLKGERKKRATCLPENWELDQEDGEWAENQGLRFEDIKFEEAKFKDYWISTGKPKVDWKATWRNWIRSSLERKVKNGLR